MPEATFASEVLEFMRIELQRIEQVDAVELSLDADIAELGIESITLLELVGALEDRYGIEIANDDLTTLSTLRDVITLTQQQIAAKG